MQHELIDEYRLLVHPVALGHGKRLPPEGSSHRALRLVESTVTSTGVMVGRYQPAGKPAFGDFGLEELGERSREHFSEGILDMAADARRRQR